MKICMLASAQSIHTIRWANAFIRLGHEVHLITMHSPNNKNEINTYIKIHELSVKNNLGYYLNKKQVKKILKNINPDILNAHYASGYGTLARLCKIKPYVLSVWGSDVFEYPYRSFIANKIIKKNLKYADEIAVTSNAIKNQVQKLCDDIKSIVITPFGINTEKFKKIDSIKNECIYIGVVKSLKPIYGITCLLKALPILFKKLKQNNKNEYIEKIKVIIVGDGAEKRNLEKLCTELKIDSKVLFLGEKSNVEIPSIINEFSIACLPSLNESFGVSAIEASACEVPVVASNVGGLPEVVINNKTGFLFKRENINELAEKLYELVINKTLREEFGKKGRELVLRKYSWDKNVKTLENTFVKLLE